MYRVLWDGEHLLVDTNDALRFLAQQAYQGSEIIHWAIVPKLSSIPYEILGLVCVKLLHMKRYEEFDNLIQNIYEDPEHQKAFDGIVDELEWMCLYIGDDWTKNTPFFQGILASFTPSISTLSQAVEHIIANEKFIYDDNWEAMVRDVVDLAKTASDEEVEIATGILLQYNWFRNWLIYLIKITILSQREYNNEDVANAFTYLVRDLDPFRGEPRACDLYKQLPLIKKSFHRGLLLCKGDERLLAECCELLEKVTNLTTSLQRSFNGPLTDEGYLEIIAAYMPGKYVINKYEEYYEPLGSRRVYSEVAEIAFEYASVLSNAGRDDEAKLKYIEGIQALTAYGHRKDRTLSEVLYCSVPYHQTYGTLGVEWFFELYHMAMTVVTHTDGKSTSSYPIEWFKEFIDVYPDEALNFLVSETLESSEANWHHEDEFYYILEECAPLFTPTQWFLLCRSLPLASSNEILARGLDVFDQIDDVLKETYSRWLQSRPYVNFNPESDESYSQEVSSQFEKKFGITIESNNNNPTETASHNSDASLSPSIFPTTSGDDALAFLETNSLQESHLHQFKELLLSIADLEEKEIMLRQAAKSFRSGRDVGNWVNNIFEPESHEWLYFNVSLFVFVQDGWSHGLHHTDYLKCAYEISPTETVVILKKVLGYYLSGDGYSRLISCNLIKALSELQVEESIVQELIQITFQLVKRRLPHPSNSEINEFIYKGLDDFSRDEMVVALLIARLKTLTTEKTQGIIWSLSFIAQTAPRTLFKPYSWAFSQYSFLLPIHRAVLLQILKEYIDQSLIPDELIGQLINNYPTGFFLEDQYIRSFVDYKMELDEKSAGSILFEADQYDKGFFPYIHPKYRTLVGHFGYLSGTYKAYAYKRDKISKEHNSYYIRTEEIITPIVSLANASYEIVNSQYYDSLKELINRFDPSYSCDLRFLLAEIILQVGALSRRPSYLPTPKEFPSFEVRGASSPFEHAGWVVLATKEDELYGEHFKPKTNRSSSLSITTKEPGNEEDIYARYLFKTDLYEDENIDSAPIDQPICKLTIIDTLERSSVFYVTPFVIRELSLKVDFAFHNGIQARNDKGEVIIKITTWKEDYYGDISDGTEVPRLTGSAVMIRADYYEQLLALYQEEIRFVLRSEDRDDG